MQPYDRDRQDEIDEMWANVIPVEPHITDEDLREQGYTESKEYPGYFENDPRYPRFSVEDRYLMDHPGPDWKTKPSLAPDDTRLTARRRTSNDAQSRGTWDDDQLSGQPLEAWDPPKRIPVQAPKPTVLQTPTTSYVHMNATTVAQVQEPDPKKYSAVWLCQVCGTRPALWPLERFWRRNLGGVVLTAVFCSPVACTECRLFEQDATRAMDRQGRRPFWKKVIGYWERDWRLWLERQMGKLRAQVRKRS